QEERGRRQSQARVVRLPRGMELDRAASRGEPYPRARPELPAHRPARREAREERLRRGSVRETLTGTEPKREEEGFCWPAWIRTRRTFRVVTLGRRRLGHRDRLLHTVLVAVGYAHHHGNSLAAAIGV